MQSADGLLKIVQNAYIYECTM